MLGQDNTYYVRLCQVNTGYVGSRLGQVRSSYVGLSRISRSHVILGQVRAV